MNTHQPLERTYAHQHDGHAHDADGFCVDCFKEDRRRKDLRGALALRGILELGNLAKLRAARSGRRAGDEYSKILDPDRLRSDLFSGDREIRRAALKAKVFIADYLITGLCWLIPIQPTRLSSSAWP